MGTIRAQMGPTWSKQIWTEPEVRIAIRIGQPLALLFTVSLKGSVSTVVTYTLTIVRVSSVTLMDVGINPCRYATPSNTWMSFQFLNNLEGFLGFLLLT